MIKEIEKLENLLEIAQDIQRLKEGSFFDKFDDLMGVNKRVNKARQLQIARLTKKYNSLKAKL